MFSMTGKGRKFTKEATKDGCLSYENLAHRALHIPRTDQGVPHYHIVSSCGNQ